VFAQLFEVTVGNPPLRRTSADASFNMTDDLVAQYTTSLPVLHYSKRETRWHKEMHVLC